MSKPIRGNQDLHLALTAPLVLGELQWDGSDWDIEVLSSHNSVKVECRNRVFTSVGAIQANAVITSETVEGKEIEKLHLYCDSSKTPFGLGELFLRLTVYSNDENYEDGIKVTGTFRYKAGFVVMEGQFAKCKFFNGDAAAEIPLEVIQGAKGEKGDPGKDADMSRVVALEEKTRSIYCDEDTGDTIIDGVVRTNSDFIVDDFYSLVDVGMLADGLVETTQGITAKYNSDDPTEEDYHYDHTEIDGVSIKDLKNGKQDKLIAGDNIKIEGNVISATGGGSAKDAYTKEETDALLAGKADVSTLEPIEQAVSSHGSAISDLDVIMGQLSGRTGELEGKLSYVEPYDSGSRLVDGKSEEMMDINVQEHSVSMSDDSSSVTIVMNGNTGTVSANEVEVDIISLGSKDLSEILAGKQDTLIPGEGINIAADGKTISASGGGGISDVKIGDASIVTGGVANIPMASNTAAGVAKVRNDYGIMLTNGNLRIYPTEEAKIADRTNAAHLDYAVTLRRLDYAVKAAMCDGVGAAWTDAEKEAARQRIGTSTPIATEQPVGGFLPNVLYTLGLLTGAVTFALAAGTAADEYMIQFSTGDTAPTITWFAGVSWLGGSAPTINANKTYQVSVVNNLAVIGEF